MSDNGLTSAGTARPAPGAQPPRSSSAHGLVAGGRGGPEDELLEDGQEEVFSRTEVEMGVIEHGADLQDGTVVKRGPEGGARRPQPLRTGGA